MKTYGTPAPADPFARSRICFESLAEDLAGDRAGEMTHDQRSVASATGMSAPGIVLGQVVVSPRIPHDDRAGAVLTLGNRAFEVRVLDRVVLGPYSEPFVPWVS